MNIIEIVEIVEEINLMNEPIPNMSMRITKDQRIEVLKITIEAMNIPQNKRTQHLSHIIKIIKTVKSNNKNII